MSGIGRRVTNLEQAMASVTDGDAVDEMARVFDIGPEEAREWLRDPNRPRSHEEWVDLLDQDGGEHA